MPLSDQAVALLESQRRVEGSELIFPSPRSGKMISDMTMNKVLRDMKVDAVPHGFRSSFRDWAAERTSFPNHVCELALAHAIGDKVEAAYRRGDLYEKREKLMAAWAVFCVTPSAPAAGKVVPIHGRKSS